MKKKFSKNKNPKILLLLWVLLLECSTLSAALQQRAPSTLTFATSTAALGGTTPALYVGAGKTALKLGSTEEILKYKLAQIIANPNGGEAISKILNPFAPTTATVDGTSGDHPLKDHDTIIAQMTTLAGQYPLLALAKYDPEGKTPPADAGIFLVNDTHAGAALSKAAHLLDTAGTAITAPPAALAAGTKYAFAAVANAGTQFDDKLDTTRGIAVMKFGGGTTHATSEDEAAAQASPELQQISIDNSDVIQALPIDLGTQGAPILAFGDGTANSIAQALVGKNASMCWDETLQRLYVGFTDVRRNDPSKVGGVLGVCMAYPSNNPAGELQSFVVNPIVDTPEAGKFYTAPVPNTAVATIYENSNPKGNTAAAATTLIPAGAGTTRPTNLVAPYNDTGYPVDLAKINVCLKVLQAATSYVKTHPGGGNTAENLLTYLKKTPLMALPNPKIFANAAIADSFLSDFEANAQVAAVFGNPLAGAANLARNSLVIFGVATPIGAAQDGADTDATLRDAIRARLVQLLANAKIVNKAYAQTNESHSAFTNSLDFIIGLYVGDTEIDRQDFTTGIAQARNDANDDLAVSIPHCAVMQTSTGRPYLIVHSIMSTSPFAIGGTFYTEADNWIYALPLIREPINGKEDTKGTIAKVANNSVGNIDLTVGGANPGQYQPPIDLTDMPRRYQTAVRVGGGNPVPASWVQNMFVSGDSVYIALAGIQKGQQGIFKSTALFDKDGCIINWTPATRVMGSAVQTYAAMLDPQSASFYSLTQTPSGTAGSSGPTTAQITQWGSGQANMHGGDSKYALDTVLSGLFESSSGGVHGITSFDEMTYGFPKKQLAMMLAYGYNKVALVKTGESNGTSFSPVLQFTTEDVAKPVIKKNVWTFSDAAVSNIGPILCGSVVHNPGNWTRFYIGGYQGLAHLEGATPLAAAAVANFTPSPLIGGVNFGTVLAVGQTVVNYNNNAIATSNLHVLTDTGISLQQVFTTNGTAIPVNKVPLSNVVDGTVLADGTIAATSAGLQFVSAAGAGPTPLNCPITQILQIETITARDKDGLPCLPAVVYVLGMGAAMPDDAEPKPEDPATSTSSEMVQMWRIAVTKDAGVVSGNVLDKYKTNPTMLKKDRPFAQYPDVRLNFNTDGSVWFDASSKDGFNNDFLRVTALTTPLSLPGLGDFTGKQASLTDQLNVDRTTNFKIAVPRRESASGAWFVPGDWGLRVNE